MVQEVCNEADAIMQIEEDEPRAFVSATARWDYIISKTENIGEAIDEGFA